MKVAVVGSRDFMDKDFMWSCLDDLHSKRGITCIVSGGARGADWWGEKWAESRGVERQIFLPDWDKHGKAAGYIRNRQIVENSDVVMAWWDGESKGTKHSIDLALGIGKKLITFTDGSVNKQYTKTR